MVTQTGTPKHPQLAQAPTRDPRNRCYRYLYAAPVGSPWTDLDIPSDQGPHLPTARAVCYRSPTLPFAPDPTPGRARLGGPVVALTLDQGRHPIPPPGSAMNTVFLLMAQYDGLVIVPLERVCQDYFTHLTPDKLKLKVARGDIDLVLVQIEPSQKSARGVHLVDLAAYIDRQRDSAKRDHDKLLGHTPARRRT